MDRYCTEPKRAWTKPMIQPMVPTDEILKLIADANGIPVDELRARLGRNSNRNDADAVSTDLWPKRVAGGRRA